MPEELTPTPMVNPRADSLLLAKVLEELSSLFAGHDVLINGILSFLIQVFSVNDQQQVDVCCDLT